jgi:NADH-quinone oxidoreductase subunit I
MIITIKHLFTRKVTIQYPQVRERSPVYRGQQLKRDEQGRENCTAVVCALSDLRKQSQ